MSFKFQSTILLTLCMLLNPATLQANCNFEGCSGYNQNNEAQESPLTMQEARRLRNLYTSVDRDLSENLEILQDGTYQVSFSENINALFGMIAVPYGHGDYLDDDDVKISKSEIRYRHKLWKSREERWERNNELLDRYFKDKPHTKKRETLEIMEHTINYEVDDPRGKYGLLIIRERIDIDRGGEQNTVWFYRKVGRDWIKSNRTWWFEIGPEAKNTLRPGGYLHTLITSLQHDDPQVFENYLKKRKIGFTGPIVWNRVARTSRAVGRGIKFVGRWTFRAALVYAGIVGTQMAFPYAQEGTGISYIRHKRAI